MNLIADFLSTILRTVIKLAFLVFTALFVLVVVAVGIAVALLAVIWALLSGRRPALVSNFARFRQATQPFSPRAWSRRGATTNPAESDVVDVQAHEVPVIQGATGQPDRPEFSRK